MGSVVFPQTFFGYRRAAVLIGGMRVEKVVMLPPR